jgi:hypothetical protein
LEVTDPRLCLREVLDGLEEGPYLGAEAGVKMVLRDLGVDENEIPRGFVEKALEEARRTTEEALSGLWGLLGAELPHEVKETLARGNWVKAWLSGIEWETLSVQPLGKGLVAHYPLPQPLPLGFKLEARAGRVEVHLQELHARRERAYLQTTRPDGVREALEDVKALRPLFEALGLADLEAALEVLGTMGDEEVRHEGPYLLFRSGDLRVLRRGSLLGSPERDRELLLGGETGVVLATGVEVVFRRKPWDSNLGPLEVEIRWQGDPFRLWVSLNGVELDRHPLPRALAKGLWIEGGRLAPTLPPRARALVRELTWRRDPLKALEDEGFLRRVALRALSES